MTHVAHSDPYPWPYDGRLDPTRFALLSAGDQVGIAGACPAPEAARAALAAVSATVRSTGGQVVHVRYGRRSVVSAPFMPVIGSAGWALTAEPDPADAVVDAVGWDATFGSELERLLRATEITTVALGGMASEVTVDSTVRALNDRGVECLVLTDACAPLDPELGRRAHASLTMSGGIFGALGTTPALIAALLAARSPEVQP